MTNNSNMTATIELGREAARRWALASSHGDAGDANAIVALVHADRVMTFTATVERKKEDTAEEFEFSIRDLNTPYINNDGSKDTRKMAARTICLFDRLFGIVDVTNAHKARLSRCVKSAIYLLESLSSLSDEELFETVSVKSGKLSVPYGLVIEEPAEDASSKEKAVYAAMKDDPIALDGKENLSLAQLGRRAAPPKDKRAAGENKSNGASLDASIDFVSAVVAQWNNPNGETDAAPSKEIERKLFALQSAIASYFVANPIGEEDLEPAAVAA